MSAPEGGFHLPDEPGMIARPFVGRARESAVLAAALADALAGRGRLMLVTGEPGIGKTRLCDEVSAAARAEGISVFWGRCWEAGGAPAYWPWGEILAGLARSLPDDQLEVVLGEGAALLAGVVPEVRGRIATRLGALPPTPDEARFRLWRAVGALAREVAAPSGLLLVLEDLHAADEPSLLLLLHLARELRAMRLLVIATFRDVEARFDPPVGDLVARIGREGATLSLGRLDRDEAAQFLRQRIPQAPADVEAKIFESTQGNPLFLEEMVRLMGDAGAEAVMAGDVPDGVREAIRQRLARVPDAARPLLDLAAVAGDQIDTGLLAAALADAGTPPDRAGVELTLRLAARAGVIGNRAGQRRFSHALVREVLYRALSDDQRRQLHGQVAAGLGRLHAGRTVAPVAELAHHLLAGPPAGLARAVDCSVQAAARALETLAYEEAVATLVRAADAVEAANNPPGLQAQVLLALAQARIRSGDAEGGKRLCCEVATLARGSNDAGQLAEAALTYGWVFTFAVVDPVLVALLEEALDLLPAGDSPLRARLLGRLAAALTPAQSCAEPVRVAREAIATARRLGDDRTLLDTLYAAIAGLMDIVDPRERRALNLETEQLALRFGERERLLRTHGRLVVDAMELGDFAGADARIDAYEALARELHAPWYLWRAPLLRGLRALLHGRFAESERRYDEAVVMGRTSADPQVERCLLLHRHALLRAAERHDELVAFEPTVRRSMAGLFNGHAWQAALAAMTYARLEDLEKTRLHLSLMPADLIPSVDNVFAIFYVAEPVALTGTSAQAERLLAMLAPSAETDVMLGFTQLSWEGPVARLMALLLARMERWDEADKQFAAAVDRCRRLDAHPYRARTEYEWARALLTRGRSEDLARAAPLLDSARAGAGAMHLSGLLRLIDGAAAKLGQIAATAATAATAETAVTARVAITSLPISLPRTTNAVTAARKAAPFTMTAEGEVWAMVYEGKVFRMKDSLGLQYLARLFAEPDRDVHVLDLVGGRRGGDDGVPQGAAVDAGDAGELLDEEARDSYRGRLEDLRDALAEAESFADATRAAGIRAEIEFLAAELGRAVGLGGRARRAGSAAERARSAVQRRIKNALSRIEEQDPALAKYLARTVKTGNFCVFRPAADA